MAACMALIAAIVGGGSGLSVRSIATERPAWSTCGKVMCDCAKTPDCPLCPSIIACGSHEAQRGVSFELMSSDGIDLAIEAFVASLVIVMGHAPQGPIIAPAHDLGVLACLDGVCPTSRGIDLDTPPPRVA